MKIVCLQTSTYKHVFFVENNIAFDQSALHTFHRDITRPDDFSLKSIKVMAEIQM